MRIFIFGSGGHARKVYHYALACGLRIGAFVDDDAEAESPIAGVPLLAPARELPAPEMDDVLIVAIGNAGARRRIMEEMSALGWRLPPLVHPSAVVAADAHLEAGVLIAAGAIVETGSVIGRGTIIDIGVRIDHDCRVGSFCHLRPGAVLPPRAHIEDAQHVG